MSLSEAMMTRAAGLVDGFARLVADIAYERKGVLFSEMLFVQAILAELGASRIIESGRARGQSTHLLAACFPATEILSIEHDPRSPDVEVAAQRLASFPNVQLLFGDSMTRLPQLLQRGDAVLIDGPKGFRAIRLALRLLRTGLPSAIFVHDCCRGSQERMFLDRYMHDVLYSDMPAFVDRYAFLDERCSDVVPEIVNREPDQRNSYGPTFACLIPDPHVDYKRLLRRLVLAGLVYRIGRARSRWS